MSRVSILFGAAVVASAAGAYVKNDFEKTAPNEDRVIEALAANAAAQVAKHRDAHAKANGCIGGVHFEVRRDLPREYRVGIFATPGAEYSGILRSSNGSGEVAANDTVGGGQGLALKLFIEKKEDQARLHKIKGEAYFDEVDRKTYVSQDFLGINFPEFFVKDAADYVVFFTAKGKAAAAAAEAKKAGKTPAEIAKIAEGTFAKEFLLDERGKLKRPREAAVLKELSRKALNPLVEEFHSMVPSLYGPTKAVKYKMAPCDPKAAEKYKLPEGIDTEKDQNYLRKTLAAHLRSEKTCYELSAVFHGEGSPSVEDAVAKWPGEYVVLGRFTVDKKVAGKEFLTDDECEFPSFSPWRTLPEHQPIGSIQRVRERVYAEVFRARHKNRGHQEK